MSSVLSLSPQVAGGGDSCTVTTAGSYAFLIVQGEIDDGATIHFYVDGQKAGQTFPFHDGWTTTLNLTVPAAPPVEYTLTMAVGGSGTTEPSAGDHDYNAGTVVVISATPDAGWQFVNWTGAVADPNSATTTVTMDANKTVTANFSEIPVTDYTLTMAVNGNGSTSPAVGPHDYAPDTVVSIIATPGSGWQFDDWTGDVANPNSATTTVTMDSDKTVTANFEVITTTPTTPTPPDQYTLIISSSSGGSVTVPGEGAFACDDGAVVSLVASRSAGYKFDNWTGNVSTVANTNDPTTKITMNGDYTIRANFEAITPTVTPTVTTTKTVTKTVTKTATKTVTQPPGTITETLPPTTTTEAPPPVTTTETLPPTTATETQPPGTITETLPPTTTTTTLPPGTVTQPATTVTTTVTEPGEPTTNWPLIWCLIAAVLFVGWGVFFWMRWRARR